MHKRTAKRRCLVIVSALVASLAIAGGYGGAAHVAQAASAPPAPVTDARVTSLAAAQGLSVGEAAKRIGWQDAAETAVPAAKAALGSRFGGAWIDVASGRVKVGVASGSTAQPRAMAASGLQGATDVVTVGFSDEQLQRAAADLGARIVQANRGAKAALSVRVVASSNRVELGVPAARLTAAQQAVVTTARTSYPTLVATRAVRGTGMARTYACQSVDANQFPDTECDPPLRGGLDIFTGGAAGMDCTSGFLARSNSDNALYLLTAGHCVRAAGRGTPWGIDSPTFGVHAIGGGWNFAFGGAAGDSAIIRVADNTFWKSRAIVLVNNSLNTTRDTAYYISRAGTPIQGARVCKSGAFGGTSCGLVTASSVVVPYPEGTVNGLVEADYCSQPGDSGGPIYSGHVAYGLVSGGVDGVCDSFFEPISRAQAQMHVHIAVGK